MPKNYLIKCLKMVRVHAIVNDNFIILRFMVLFSH
jgi:hypothetical protein